MSLSYTDLKKGVIFVYEGSPYEVLEANFLRMQQRKAVVQTKIRNLITGKVLDRNWQPSDQFEEADVQKKSGTFIYTHRDECWFTEGSDPKKRFALSPDTVGEGFKFLKPNTQVTMVTFDDKIISVILPIKMELKVIEAPPALRGNTAQGGTKQVTLEGGAVVNVPLFIEEGEVIRINTQTGDYVERVKEEK